MLLNLFIHKMTTKTNQKITDMATMHPNDDVDSKAMVRAT